jgi:RNA polymerase sigma-70 factor (ECF subfamily)
MNKPEKAGRGRVDQIFNDLYEAYSSAIFKFGYRLLGDREDAGDITQETFSRLYQALGDSREIQNPRAWIYTVAANICRDSLRRRKKGTKFLYAREQNRRSMDSEHDSEFRQRDTAVRTALASLNERDQLLLMLYLDDLSYRDMAQAAGVKMTSVGKVLQRAIERLARIIRNGEKT